jgi:hypothetical protein
MRLAAVLIAHNPSCVIDMCSISPSPRSDRASRPYPPLGTTAHKQAGVAGERLVRQAVRRRALLAGWNPS